MRQIIYTATFMAPKQSPATIAAKLQDWGQKAGLSANWILPAGATRDPDPTKDLFVLLRGTVETPQLGVTLLPVGPAIRVSYYVGVDDTHLTAETIALELAAVWANEYGLDVTPHHWDLYGRGDENHPTLLIESGGFRDHQQDQMAPSGSQRWN